MKTKLFMYNELLQVQYETGEIFTQKKKETIEDFRSRFSSDIEIDWDKPIDIKAIKRKGTDQLIKAHSSAVGFNLGMIGEILALRGKLPKDAKNIDVKDAKEVKPKKQTLDHALNLVKKSKKNIGSKCSLVPFRTAFRVEGTIKQVVLDRRVNKVYYRIMGEDKKLYHTHVNNKNFKLL